MNSTALLTVIGGIIVVALIVAAIVIRFKNNPTAYDKELAKNFIEGLGDTIYKKIVNIINNIDFSIYESLAELEVDILTQIYDEIWVYVEGQLEEAAKDDVLTALAIKVINKEYVDKFIDGIMEQFAVNDTLSTSWDDHMEKMVGDIEKEDERIQDEYNDPEQYNESFENEDLPLAEEVVPTDEEISSLSLNPPSEEAEVYEDGDESVEVLEETEEVVAAEDNFLVDEHGRKHDKETGRYI